MPNNNDSGFNRLPSFPELNPCFEEPKNNYKSEVISVVISFSNSNDSELFHAIPASYSPNGNMYAKPVLAYISENIFDLTPYLISTYSASRKLYTFWGDYSRVPEELTISSEEFLDDGSFCFKIRENQKLIQERPTFQATETNECSSCQSESHGEKQEMISQCDETFECSSNKY
mmetsp:Transcript_7489/g.6814  ORF Transcript_7489/g.6814 Transcript_7489/m.6814 type:complete len:174 (+) Transcript_7489:236-757(+)